MLKKNPRELTAIFLIYVQRKQKKKYKKKEKSTANS